VYNQLLQTGRIIGKIMTHPNPEDYTFDLERVLSSVVSLQTRIPEDAMTASVLGTERAGHGVLINDSGLILTIGYLITEAETVWIVANNGQAVPAYAIGYDQETGFGMVQTLQSLTIPAIHIGNSATLNIGEPVIVAGHGGIENAVKAHVIAKQEFAGYWEYLLDEAIFTTPPHPNWGGAAVIGKDGTLCGIGSLLVQEASTDDAPGGNMIVPIDLLKPIIQDMQVLGRANRSPRPWLGMMTTEVKGALVIVGVVEGGPAERASLKVGDLVLEVNNEPVSELAMMFRYIWNLGEAGVAVPLLVLRNGETMEITIQSVNRYDYLKTPNLH
jgi:S1-C subfamily serine protease